MAARRKSSSKPALRQSGKSGKKKSRRSWLRHPLTISVASAAVTVGLGAVVYYVQNQHPAPAPSIELDSVQVQHTYIDGHSATGTASLAYKIYFDLRNTGNQLAIIRALSAQVESFTRIPICFSQGDLPTTGHYTANMPLNPRLGSVIEIPVSQQAAPDTADRFEVTLRIPPDMDEAIYLYRLHLSLLYDNLMSPVDAGNVFISLPFDPTTEQYVWNRPDQATHGQPMAFMGKYVTEISKCMISNAKKVRSLLSLSGIRSSGLASLPSIMSYCCVLNYATMPPVLGQAQNGNQKGYGQTRPGTIFNGGDPTGLVLDIHWQSWGGHMAVGEGTGLWTPGIVADGHNAPVRIVAFDLGSCNGVRSYNAVEWYFPEHGETFSPGTATPTCPEGQAGG